MVSHRCYTEIHKIEGRIDGKHWKTDCWYRNAQDHPLAIDRIDWSSGAALTSWTKSSPVASCCPLWGRKAAPVALISPPCSLVTAWTTCLGVDFVTISWICSLVFLEVVKKGVAVLEFPRGYTLTSISGPLNIYCTIPYLLVLPSASVMRKIIEDA